MSQDQRLKTNGYNMKINFRKHFYFILFFSAFFITGLFIYDDYGICWDEPLSHDYNGLINYNFLLHGDYKSLSDSPEKYHGPVVEILLVGIEKIFKMTDVKNIYHVRHLVLFLIFIITTTIVITTNKSSTSITTSSSSSNTFRNVVFTTTNATNAPAGLFKY